MSDLANQIRDALDMDELREYFVLFNRQELLDELLR